MENPEEVLQWLEEVSRRRPASIPRALDEYLAWVARTGEPLFRWPLVRALLKEKLLAVLAEFRETPPGLELPPCPNVAPFEHEPMRLCFLARLDAFAGPPFTIQRICELLAAPRKHYTRVDKFMRAFEKNVLVVSTKEPEPYRRAGHRDAEPQLDGSDANSDCNVDVEMDDASDWKDSAGRSAVNGPLDPQQSSEDGTSSSEPSSSAEASDESDSPPLDEYSDSNAPVDIFPPEAGETSAITEGASVKCEDIPRDDDTQTPVEPESAQMDTTEETTAETLPTIVDVQNEDAICRISTDSKEIIDSIVSDDKIENITQSENITPHNIENSDPPTIEVSPPLESTNIEEFETTMSVDKTERVPFEPEICENAVDLDVCKNESSPPPISLECSAVVFPEESNEASKIDVFVKTHSDIEAATDSEMVEPLQESIAEIAPCAANENTEVEKSPEELPTPEVKLDATEELNPSEEPKICDTEAAPLVDIDAALDSVVTSDIDNSDNAQVEDVKETDQKKESDDSPADGV